MMTRRSFLLCFAAIYGVALTTPVAAEARPEVFARDGIAISGYDAVAYFTKAAAVKGNEDHALTWKGVTWLFSTAQTMAEFQASPEVYEPQYGGYCAYALSKNAIARTSPEAWTVQDGKLYLNYDTGVRDIWRQDIPGNIARADANWPAVLNH